MSRVTASCIALLAIANIANSIAIFLVVTR